MINHDGKLIEEALVHHYELDICSVFFRQPLESPLIPGVEGFAYKDIDGDLPVTIILQQRSKHYATVRGIIVV